MRSVIAVAFLSLVLGVFGILAATWAVRSVGRAEYLSAIVALGAAVFSFGMIAMLILVASRNVAPRVVGNESGVLVRPDRRVDGLLTTATFAGFVTMALYTIFTPLGRLNIVAPQGNAQYLLVVCAAGTLIGVISLRQIIKQRGTSSLQMGRDGLVTGNTMTTVERSWDEVAEIADGPRKARRPNGGTYITTADGHTRVLPGNWYTPGGQVLCEWIRFYWENPEAREELTDGRAVRRLESECRGTT